MDSQHGTKRARPSSDGAAIPPLKRSMMKSPPPPTSISPDSGLDALSKAATVMRVLSNAAAEIREKENTAPPKPPRPPLPKRQSGNQYVQEDLKKKLEEQLTRMERAAALWRRNDQGPPPGHRRVCLREAVQKCAPFMHRMRALESEHEAAVVLARALLCASPYVRDNNEPATSTTE